MSGPTLLYISNLDANQSQIPIRILRCASRMVHQKIQLMDVQGTGEFMRGGVGGLGKGDISPPPLTLAIDISTNFFNITPNIYSLRGGGVLGIFIS